MPLRQTQGVQASFKKLLAIPHYSTLARRGAELVVPQISCGLGIGPLHLAIDSPLIGLGGRKVFGEGAWKIKLHGKDNRRVWVPRYIWR
jgi:hypothetical protein